MSAVDSYNDFLASAGDAEFLRQREEIEQRTNIDPGWPFRPEALQILRQLRVDNIAAFQFMKSVLRDCRVDVRALDAAVDDVRPKPNGAAPSGTDKQQIVLLTAPDFVAGYRPQRPLIKAWDTKRGWLYSFTAPTGFAKTAIALGEALNQASACRSVLYLAGENADDVRARMLVMQDRLSIKQLPDSLQFVDRTFNMPDTMEFVRGRVSAIGGADLIVVDTSPAFQAASGAIEENSNTEQLRWAMTLRQMTKFDGSPAVIALCHPTKRPQTIEECLPRGGGSFLAEVDGNYVSWLKADDGERKFFDLTWTGKFRGSFEPMSYVVEVATCDALADPDGNLIKTVWAHTADEQQMERASREQNEAEDAALKVMADHPNKSLAVWAGLLGWKKWQMQRVVDRLQRDKFAQKYRSHYRLTNTGKNEAAEASERIRSAAK